MITSLLTGRLDADFTLVNGRRSPVHCSSLDNDGKQDPTSGQDGGVDIRVIVPSTTNARDHYTTNSTTAVPRVGRFAHLNGRRNGQLMEAMPPSGHLVLTFRALTID